MTKAKDISIKTYLAKLGVSPKTERENSGMYLSPLRSERTPSFRVDYSRNLWYDFGTGEGGSIIDLVMKMENCNVAEAFKRLENQTFSPTKVYEPVQHKSPIEIIKVTDLKNRNLLDYLATRAINIEIAYKYCQEVHYKMNSKRYYAIGFESDSGSWELRNEYFKGGNSPKAPTTIHNGSDTCLIFEGFMDMLSYLTLRNCIDPKTDLVVLNSVVNLKKAIYFISQHKNIHCLLDNDTAGKQALEQLQKQNLNIVDNSKLYQNHKDLNEYLQTQRPRRRMKI